ncbi:MAG TPA: DUF1206 domain-containing protein [Nocardioides sp.]|nr:DUF1206 domain-containing protein [Nocardioides sp.]
MTDVRQAARRAHHSDAVDHAVRVGLVAYGVVHLLVGWLALQLAFGDREGSASSNGALRELAQQPFGRVLVWVVAVGLALLALWQLLEAAAGHRTLRDRKRLWHRAASAGKVLVYGYLSYSAFRVAVGAGSSGSGTDSMTAQVMDLPGGQVLVGLVGAGVVAVGGYLVWKGITDGFRDDLTSEGQRGNTGDAYLWLGRVGYAAKGIALGLVGVLFGWAAATHDARRSGGLDQALQEVLDQPFGPYLLGAVALGILGFGLFCFAHARHLSR